MVHGVAENTPVRVKRGWQNRDKHAVGGVTVVSQKDKATDARVNSHSLEVGQKNRPPVPSCAERKSIYYNFIDNKMCLFLDLPFLD